MNIIDRRLNPKGKSLPNRQRLLQRLKGQVRQAVAQSLSGRRVADIKSDQAVPVPARGMSEPSFEKGDGGIRDMVMPGNQHFIKGDQISRPPPGGGAGREGADGGEGEDEFSFTLTQEEFLNIFFEDLELPDMVKRRLKQATVTQSVRAGISASGTPQCIDLVRSMRNGLARRIALGRPRGGELQQLEARLAAAEAAGDAAESARLAEELEALRRKCRKIPWIDPFDIRYRRYEQRPQPVAQAVMFCLMDVSGSMNEHMKDLAKRFFMLLYLFLHRRYEAVDIVFIRHTHEAREVDEETFFRSRETGGTVVSTALDAALEIIAERYPVDSWNIYLAQASDGDNSSADRAHVAAAMSEGLLPVCQYFAYLEVDDPPVGGGPERPPTELWRTYETLLRPDLPLAMRRARTAADIASVFLDLFSRDKAA